MVLLSAPTMSCPVPYSKPIVPNAQNDTEDLRSPDERLKRIRRDSAQQQQQQQACAMFVRK